MFMRFDEAFIGYVFCFVPVKENDPVNDNGWSIDRDMEQVMDSVFMTFRRNVRIYECKIYHIEDSARCKSMHIAVHNSPDLEDRLIFTLSKDEFEMDDWCFYKDGETNVECYHEVSVEEGQLLNGLVWFVHRPMKDELIDIFIEDLQQQIDNAEWTIKHYKEGIKELNALREAGAE